MFKVTYNIRKDGYLVANTKTFETMKSAIKFIRQVQTMDNVMGRPILEQI